MSDIVEQLASAPVKGTHRHLLDRAISEIQSLRGMLGHDNCNICHRPQWVSANGEHRCKSITELQEQYEKDTQLLDFWNDFINVLQKKVTELELQHIVHVREIQHLTKELQALKETTDLRNRNG